jgi:hypothetical protein
MDSMHLTIEKIKAFFVLFQTTFNEKLAGREKGQKTKE